MATVEEMPVDAVAEPTDVGKRDKAKPDPEPAKTLFAMKGDPSWYDWLKRYADFLGIPLTTAIDIALREQAKRDKFTEPMPKRFGR